MSKAPEMSQYRTSEIFKKRLIHAIYDKGCSKKQFAALMGVSEPIITRATLYGIVPTVPILIKIANSLNVSLEYLMGFTEIATIYLSDSPSTFHIRIEQLIREATTNYGKLSEQLTFPRTYFYEWQKEKTFPSLDYLIELSNHFNVSIDYLTGRTEDRHNPTDSFLVQK